MLLDSILNQLQTHRKVRRADHGHADRRPRFETLEDRCLLSLTAAVNYPVGIEPQAVVVGDFNNDGRLDIATANHGGGSVSLLLGNGQGGFDGAVEFPTGPGPNCMAVGDFNNDGKLDLVTGSETTGKVNVLLGNGNGAFAAPIHSDVDPLSVQPLSIAVGDLGQDGTMDLLVGARYRDPTGEFDDTGEVAVLVGNNTGSFRWVSTYGTGYGMPTDIAVVDLNGDSILDIVTNYDAPLYAITVFIRPIVDWPNFYDTGDHPQSLALGDFTGDGNLDVITAGDTIDILSGNGRGAFAAAINQPIGGGPYTSVAAGDFNGDGKLDAVVTSETGYAYVLLGNDNGSLSLAGTFAVGSQPTAIVIGDFNRDGQPDAAVANRGSNNVSVLLNDGNWSGETALIGDYNQNGRVDAADYVVWRKTQGMMVTPSSGADGNGDGMVDQDDYGVWRSRFGQMSSPPAAGSGVNVAGEIEAQAAEATGVREQTNLGRPQVGKTKSSVEVRRASEKQRAMMVRESAFVELLARPTTSLAQIRLALRSLQGAGVLLQASGRHDALLMWVSKPDSKRAVNAWQSGNMLEDKEANNAGDAFFESIDEVFSLLTSG